jgi:hypothetical protein
VPRRVLADAHERLLLVDNLRPLHLREGIHRCRSGRRRRLLERRRIGRRRGVGSVFGVERAFGFR